MALIQKIAPRVGIDRIIDNLQVLLWDGLLLWQNAIKGYNSYSKAEKNEVENGRLPEVFTGGKEYKEVFTDDDFSATSFFLVGNNRPIVDEVIVQATIDIIFQVNLQEIYGGREDEQAHRDVFLILKNNPWTYSISDSLVTGISEVYSGLKIDQVKFDDMQPFHVFKVSMVAEYDMSCN